MGAVVAFGVELVGGLVVVTGYEVLELGIAPGFVVALKEGSRADGESGDSDAGQREVVAAIVVAGRGVGIGRYL